MDEFLTAVADALEVDAIGPDDEFRAVEGWCSLKAFGLLVLLENDWKTPVSLDRFLTLNTPRDLWREVESHTKGE